MFSGLHPIYKGILLAFTGYTAFAVSDICAKWLAEQGYSLYQIIAIDCLIAVGLLLALSPFVPVLWSLLETLYQWERPFLVDDDKLLGRFPELASSLDVAVAETAKMVSSLARGETPHGTVAALDQYPR